jgi:hypothetical protein
MYAGLPPTMVSTNKIMPFHYSLQLAIKSGHDIQTTDTHLLHYPEV